MSIIYDALKKVQGQFKENKGAADPANNAPGAIPARSEQPTLPAPPRRNKLVLILLVVLGAVALYYFFNYSAAQKRKKEEEAKKQSPAYPLFKTIAPLPGQKRPQTGAEQTVPGAANLVLNGTVSSEYENYALINNQIVQEGDQISGLKVKKISSEGVELEDKDGKITRLR